MKRYNYCVSACMFAENSYIRKQENEYYSGIAGISNRARQSNAVRNRTETVAAGDSRSMARRQRSGRSGFLEKCTLAHLPAQPHAASRRAAPRRTRGSAAIHLLVPTRSCSKPRLPPRRAFRHRLCLFFVFRVFFSILLFTGRTVIDEQQRYCSVENWNLLSQQYIIAVIINNEIKLFYNDSV